MRALALLALLCPLPALAGATTVSVDALTVDGQEVRSLRCELAKGGLFASMAVVGALAKQKAALDACAPAGAAFEVTWTWGGVEARGVTVARSSAAGADACVVEALRGTVAPSEGTCTATVLVGEAAAAAKAAEALAAPGAGSPQK